MYDCLLCEDKEGKDLSIGLTDLRELQTHYSACFYNLVRLKPYLDPGEGNRDYDGKAVDEYGRKYRYTLGCFKNLQPSKHPSTLVGTPSTTYSLVYMSGG